MILSSAFVISSLLPLLYLLGALILASLINGVFKIKSSLFTIELLIGIIMGSFAYFQNLYHQPLYDGLYTVGLVFFLFLSGLDTDFSFFTNKNKKHFSLLILVIKLVYIVGFALSFILFKEIKTGEFWIGIGLITIFLTSSFASVIIPLLHQKKIDQQLSGKILSAYASIAELLSIVLLSVLMIIKQIHEGAKPWLLVIVLILLLVLLVGKKRLPSNFSKHNHSLTIRISLFVVLLLAILSEQSGAEIILGAFLVGMTFKFNKISHQTFEKIEHIGYDFLIPIFFILVGFKIPVADLLNGPILYLTLLVLVLLILTKLPLLFLFQYLKLKKVLPVFLLSTITLIVAIAINHFDILSSDLNKALVLASSLTCLITPVLFHVFIIKQPVQID